MRPSRPRTMPTRVLTLFVILSLNARRASAVGLSGVDVAEDVSLIDPELEYDDSQVMEALDHASVQQWQWPQQPQQPQQPPQQQQQPQQPQQQQWYDHAALPVEVTGRQLAEEKKTPNGRKYCNTTQYGLKGDYAYEACGTFCKAEKATNQCAGRSAQSDCPPSAKRTCSDRLSRPPPSVQLQVLQMPSVRVLQVDADAQQRGQEA